MNRSKHAASVTSLPTAPRDESDARVRKYAITMTIRIVCFLLMAVVQPYGWYTWVFAAAAAVLPYFAVVIANAGSDSTRTQIAESPERQIEAPAPPPAEPGPTVLIMHEKREDDAS